MAKAYHEALHPLGNLGIQVSMAALENTHIPAHWHEAMEILFCLNGSVRIHIERGDDLNSRDASGMTPLMLCAARNKSAICALLLGAGAVATSAYWTDTASATVTATSLSTPRTPVCTNTGPGGIARMTFPGLGPSYEYYVELREVANNGSLVSPPANTLVFGSGTPTSGLVELEFRIISGGGGNKDYDALIWSRLIGSTSNIGSPTVTHLQAGPEPNGANWSAYCGHKKSYPGH